MNWVSPMHGRHVKFLLSQETGKEYINSKHLGLPGLKCFNIANENPCTGFGIGREVNWRVFSALIMSSNMIFTSCKQTVYIYSSRLTVSSMSSQLLSDDWPFTAWYRIFEPYKLFLCGKWLFSLLTFVCVYCRAPDFILHCLSGSYADIWPEMGFDMSFFKNIGSIYIPDFSDLRSRLANQTPEKGTFKLAQRLYWPWEKIWL